jgi:hypothetical protein
VPNDKTDNGVNIVIINLLYFGFFRTNWIPITNNIENGVQTSMKAIVRQSMGGCAVLADDSAYGPIINPAANANALTGR